MTTVAQLIEKLKGLPQDATVEVLTATEHSGHWESHIGVCFLDIDLDKDINVVDHRDTDPVKHPTIGGKCWVEIGRDI